MNARQKHLLVASKHLMKAHERMAARWLTEDWDGVSSRVPSWLRQWIWMHYPYGTLGDPERLARSIRLRLFADCKAELGLPSES